ncbi:MULTISPECIES: hypothetical protein [unclassified Arthrobacter]|uniref:hypothetical protein n=1 Tax=unclassified Arthrobacter TaxID=235627 RepID=UPI0015E32694|nr:MULTISPECIES: hypothetical protein [unclassified Arthrobacter]
MSNLKITETTFGQLTVETPRGDFTIEPLPARAGAPLASMVMGVSFAGDGLTVEEQENMYKTALGLDNWEWIFDSLRLPDAQDACNLALFWQVSGLEAAQAFLDGGVEKALEVHLARMGLSLSTILRHLAAEDEIQSQDDTNDTSTPQTSESKSSVAAEKARKATAKKQKNSSGPTSSPSGT